LRFTYLGKEEVKEARERKKKNNEVNLELIKQIKSDLLNKTFDGITITKINEATDGVGFWWHCFREFPDGSSGSLIFYWLKLFQGIIH